jgi:Rieske Fe-S protein
MVGSGHRNARLAFQYIGKTEEHQYAATGFGGNGMTFGTLGGMIIADAIEGRRNPWAELFDAERTALRRGVWDYIKENASYPYYWCAAGSPAPDGKSFRSVKRGQGKVIEDRGTKVAAYRGADGTLIVRSATCTHMGCIVHGIRRSEPGMPLSRVAFYDAW